MFKKIKKILLIIAITHLSSCIGTDFIDDPTNIKPIVINVSPTKTSAQVGDTTRFAAEYLDPFGNIVQNAALAWSSSVPSIATIDSNGLVFCNNTGQTFILASFSGDTSEPALLTVVIDSSQIAGVEVTPTTAQLLIDDTLQFIAKAYNLKGDTLLGTIFNWRSSANGVVSIDNNGFAKALAAGTTEIFASANGIESSAILITVIPPSRSGTLSRTSHYDVSGTTTLILQADNNLVLNLENDFRSDTGPELHVYLSDINEVNSNSLDLGFLQSTSGAQSYTVPMNIEITTYSWVIIYCKPFTAVFGSAQLN